MVRATDPSPNGQPVDKGRFGGRSGRLHGRRGYLRTLETNEHEGSQAAAI
jgi:hypothetical protein